MPEPRTRIRNPSSAHPAAGGYASPTSTRAATYDELRAGHRWEVPARYNIATDVCDNSSDPCLVTYTWTQDTTPPVLTGCPVGSIALGCNPTALPSCADAKALVTATDDCGPAIKDCLEGSAVSNGCLHSQSFIITATDGCGNVSDPCVVTYTWSQSTAPVWSTLILDAEASDWWRWQ